MAENIEVTGRTVEEAVKLALLKLDATLDEVDIKIVDSGTSGRILGLGSREAKVLVTRRSTPFVEGEDEAPPLPAPLYSEPYDEEDFPDPEDAGVPGAEVSVEELVTTAAELVEDLVGRMGYEARVVKVTDDPPSFDVVSADPQHLESLIGPRGDTLRAFGFLVNSMLGRIARRGVRVVIDVNGYRRAREEELSEIAHQAASDVREHHEPVTLEAMPAHERRMIHLALAGDEDVRTYSIGEGKDRRVVIGPKG